MSDDEIRKRMDGRGDTYGLKLESAIEGLAMGPIITEKNTGQIGVPPADLVSFLLRNHPEEAIEAVIEWMAENGTEDWLSVDEDEEE